MEDPVIPCERCGHGGATAYAGWQLLCQRCIKEDQGEYWEEE